MKSNNLDDILKKKKNSNILFYFKIAIIIFAIFVLFFIPFTISNMISSDSKSYEIKTNGEQYGTSNFFKYQEKIYVFTLNDGMQALENVDIETFKTLNSGDYYTKNIGLDKNSVYFGNVIISDLVPNKLKVIGNGYYTDGTNSYFFSPFSELDKDSSNYIYPYKKMENIKNLKALKDFELFALDGDNVYYKGEILKNVDLNTLEIIDKNTEYFSDKKNVYYKSKLLALSSNEKLKVVRADQEGEDYLYDGLNGNVFLEEYAFDKKYLPYQVLGEKSNHIRDLLFVNKDGIFFYNPETKEQERVRDNIFIGEIEEINPSVISDDKNIYYLHSYNVYKKKKTKYGYMDVLVSKNIGIFSLGEKKEWEKIKDIDFGTTGQVWRKGNKYYYFDDLGVSQLIDDVVYEIVDNASLKYLLETNDMYGNTIREFVNDKKLIAFKGEEVTTASIKYKESHKAEIFLTVFLTIFIGIHVLILYLKWRKVKLEMKEIDEEIKKKNKEIESLIRSYDDEEEIKKEIDKIKPIVKNYDNIEALTKQDKKIDSIIKHYNDKKEEK